MNTYGGSCQALKSLHDFIKRGYAAVKWKWRCYKSVDGKDGWKVNLKYTSINFCIKNLSYSLCRYYSDSIDLCQSLNRRIHDFWRCSLHKITLLFLLKHRYFWVKQWVRMLFHDNQRWFLNHSSFKNGKIYITGAINQLFLWWLITPVLMFFTRR